MFTLLDCVTEPLSYSHSLLSYFLLCRPLPHVPPHTHPRPLRVSLPFVLPHFAATPAAILSWELCAVTVSTSQTENLEGRVIRIQVYTSKQRFFSFYSDSRSPSKTCLYSGSLEAFQSLMCYNWDSTEDPKSVPRNDPLASNALLFSSWLERRFSSDACCCVKKLPFNVSCLNFS